MTLIIRDASFNFVTSISPQQGRAGGYRNPQVQLDIEGGYAGMSAEIPRSMRATIPMIGDGFLVEWLKHDRPIGAGKVVALDDRGEDWQLKTNGIVRDWMTLVPADYTTSTSQKPSQIIGTLVGSYGPGALLSTSTAGISGSTYTIANALAYTKQTIGDIIREVNEYEGWEFGDYYPRPGHSIVAPLLFFYRAPDNVTQHYTVDVRTLAERPTLEHDREHFGNKVRAYYGTGSAYVAGDINGTAESQAKHGVIWYKIDVSGTNTTSADATQAANKFLASLKVNGIEEPPISTELVLDYGSRLRGVSGALSNMHFIEPGQNILLTGTGEIARSLSAIDNNVFLKIKTVKREENRVRLSCNKGYALPVLLARLKAKTAA